MEPYPAARTKWRKRKYKRRYFKDIDNILKNLITSEKRIKMVILVENTGHIIASVSKFSYFKWDIDSLGSIVSAIFCASEEQGNNLELGNLEIITSEFENGVIFLSHCSSNTVLALICDSHISIGLIRLTLKKFGHEINEIFSHELLKFSDPVDFYDFKI